MNKEYLDLSKYEGFRSIRIHKEYVEIITRKNLNEMFIHKRISINDNLDKYLIINHNHVILANRLDGTPEYMFGQSGTEYHIGSIHEKYHIFEINCSGANPINKVWRILKENNLNNFVMAEFGVQYGSTAQAVIDNLNIKRYDMFDYKKYDLLKYRFERYDFVNIIKGDATITTTELDDVIYDAVFFDCTHRYKSDIVILSNLLSHLNDKSIVIFHDYDMNDVRKAIEEFCTMFNGTVYALSDEQGILKLK